MRAPGGATGVARVRLPAATETVGSATSRTHTISRCGSEDGWGDEGSTLLFANVLASGAAGTSFTAFGSAASAYGPLDCEDLRAFVARMEAMQAQQRSPQQPNADLDAELAAALARRPEWRSRMAVATKSATLRKKILTIPAQDTRSVGSTMLGSTHPWLQDKVAQDEFRPRSSDKLPVHPLLSSSAFYSLSRSKRFPGTKERSMELDTAEHQRRGNPGPGAYFKSQPRGTAFSADGGETIVLGANHVCPWKKCLGRNINPVHVDGTSLTSAPSFSFPKTRRALSETSLGHVNQDGGAVKSDLGCLSPGPVYDLHGSMRPSASRALGAPLGVTRRRTRSAAGRVRMEPVPPDEPAETEEGEAT